jgi:hypothetical protein
LNHSDDGLSKLIKNEAKRVVEIARTRLYDIKTLKSATMANTKPKIKQSDKPILKTSAIQW